MPRNPICVWITGLGPGNSTHHISPFSPLPHRLRLGAHCNTVKPNCAVEVTSSAQSMNLQPSPHIFSPARKHEKKQSTCKIPPHQKTSARKKNPEIRIAVHQKTSQLIVTVQTSMPVVVIVGITQHPRAEPDHSLVGASQRQVARVRCTPPVGCSCIRRTPPAWLPLLTHLKWLKLALYSKRQHAETVYSCKTVPTIVYGGGCLALVR